MTTTKAQDKEKVVGDIAKTICEYVDAKGTGVRVLGTCALEMLYYSHNAGIAEALYEKGYRQVPEKETVKKIIEELLGYIGSNQKFCVVDDERFELIRSDKLFDFVGDLAKKYGVNLEEEYR